ncbi:maleylpyruvate isomerase family mycothiol-dependent enzyme [Nocardia sp. NPDC055321]
MAQDVWALVREERAALVRDLAAVSDDRWDVPSLCPGWTVHDVAAHLVDTARTTRLGFVWGLVRARFDFDAQNARGIERQRGATPVETLAAMRAVVSRTTTPPAPLDTRLVEEVVHGEDIRRPLGIEHEYAGEAVARALRLQAKTSRSFGGAKELVARVSVVATDADLRLGAGPEVRGTAVALLLALSGRRDALTELDGPGVETLAAAL